MPSLGFGPSRPLAPAAPAPAGPADLVVTRWQARFMGRRFPVSVGRCGIGRKEREGDGLTPAGIHRLEAILHRPDRGSARGCAIGPALGWSDDPRDPSYNAAVRLPHAFSHERMRRADRQYDLVGITDWNRHPAEAGRGSAIFLHVWRRPRHPTAGCIAFSRADLAWILARWTGRSRIIVRAGGA